MEVCEIIAEVDQVIATAAQQLKASEWDAAKASLDRACDLLCENAYEGSEVGANYARWEAEIDRLARKIGWKFADWEGALVKCGDDDQPDESGDCHHCGGSGGGEGYWRCPVCHGSGRCPD